MKKQKNFKAQIAMDLIMLAISVFMTIDYSMLVKAGDDSTRKIIALVAWSIFIIGWAIKLIYDVQGRKELVQL